MPTAANRAVETLDLSTTPHGDSSSVQTLRVILLNAGEKEYVVRRGDRIAQLVIAPVTTVEFSECDRLGATDRGEGGFGHSGRDASGCET